MKEEFKFLKDYTLEQNWIFTYVQKKKKYKKKYNNQHLGRTNRDTDERTSFFFHQLSFEMFSINKDRFPLKLSRKFIFLQNCF